MTTLANDNFTGTSGDNLEAHTSDSGHSWTAGSGSATSLGINASNQLVNESASNKYYYSSAVPAGVEYDVSLDIQGAGSTGGPAGRFSTAAYTLYTCLWNEGSGIWQLYKIIAGTATVIGSYAGDSPDTTRTCKLEIKDATKKYFIGGVERISSADNAITAAGRPGVWAISVTSYVYDNWLVEEAAGGGTVTHLVGSSLLNSRLTRSILN